MLELLASVLCFGLFLYKWLIIIAVLLTWVSADPYNPIVQWIARVTRPLWVWCEQRMPMMLAHFSPYAALLLVIFAQAVVPAELRSLNLLIEGQSDSNQILLQSGGHLLQGAAIVLQSLFFFFVMILVVWFFLTLVNPAFNNPLVRIIHVLADPLITPIQRYLPRTSVDFSPLIAMMFFMMLLNFVVGPISQYGSSLSYPVPLCVF